MSLSVKARTWLSLACAVTATALGMNPAHGESISQQTANGAALYTSTRGHRHPETASDDAVGAIDLGLIWNAFLPDYVLGIVVDGNGNVYVAGGSGSTWGSPINPHSGGSDIFVAKFSSTGVRLWNTFVGGTSIDQGFGMAVDGNGNVYVVGDSFSHWGSPVNPYSGGGDALVVKLDSSGMYLWHTYLGGTGVDTGVDVAVESNGDVYLIENSTATWGTPINAHVGDRDAFVAKLSSGGVLLWNTFMGSANKEYGKGIAVDDSYVYAVGSSGASWGSPINPYQGAGDGFAAKLNLAGALVWNTFIGGIDGDVAADVGLDESGNVYVAGGSGSTWGSPINPHSGVSDIFVAKLSSSGVPLWHTYMGSTDGDGGRALAVDNNGSVFVAGSSESTWGRSPYRHSGESDAFAAKLNSSGGLDWNIFVGGTSWDTGGAIAADEDGNVYIGGTSFGTWGTPITPYQGLQDGFVARLMESGRPDLPCDRIPVILVHGWHAPDIDSLAQDYGMNLLADMLRADGYVQGQTLFYATGIGERNTLEQNARALQQTVRWATHASGCSVVNIIAHSMGGLNTRAYIESDLYQYDVNNGIRVGKVFMLGTPNGGVDGNLIQIAFGLWRASQDGNIWNDLSSMGELTVLYVQAFNQSHTQPPGVSYHLIGGDVRSHLPILCILGACYPNDLIVARDSVHWLAYLPGHNVVTVSTSDGHGCNSLFTFIGIPTYNCPDTTYRTHIAPYLTSVGGQPASSGQLTATDPDQGLSLQYEPQEPSAHSLLFTGVISTGESITQNVGIDSSGTTAFYLGWTKGDLDLSLIDPLSTVITPSAEIDPDIDFLSIETDALFNYEVYVISDTLTGDWTLTVDAIDTHSQQVPFAAFAIPDSDLTFSVSTDQDWYPKNQAGIITATVAVSSTPISDAIVEAVIHRPDTTTDTVTLYDDGVHNDGSAADGIYGNSYASTDMGGYYAVLATANGNYAGSDYERGAETSFSVSPGTAALTGTYSDYPEDADNNGKYESLVVDVGIDVQQSGGFQLSGRLLDGNGDLVVGASEYTWLTAGTQDVPLRFYGESIRIHGVDGPYSLTNVFLFDTSEVAVKLDEALDVWTTQAYDYSIFGNNWEVHLPLIMKKH